MNGNEVVPGNNVQIQSSGTLVISNAGSSNAGWYQCFPSNTWGTAFSNVSQLEMAYLNDFQAANTKGYTATTGQPLTVTCNPPASVPTSGTVYSWATTPSTTSTTQTPVAISDRVQVDQTTGRPVHIFTYFSF